MGGRMKFKISPEAKQLNLDIFSVFYYHAIKKSVELGKEFGSYQYFKGSPASMGLFQFDLQGVKPNTRIISMEMWNALRIDMMKYLRNSMSIALMPTASTSQILSNTECIEIPTYNLYARNTLAGNFFVVNKHLVRDLIKLGLWIPGVTADRLLKARGSIQDFKEIPARIRQIYRTVWEIPQKLVLDLSADRSPYICQTQSLNLHFANPTTAILSSCAMHGFKLNLKTISYYIRSKTALDSITFSIVDDWGSQDESAKVAKKPKRIEECKEACTA